MDEDASARQAEIVNTQEVLAENRRRREGFDSLYDPFSGIGSMLERQPFELDSAVHIHLPLEAIAELGYITQKGSFREYCRWHGINWHTGQRTFSAWRCKYDFEYWAATSVKITRRVVSEDETVTEGALVPFVLNKPQRRLVAVLESMRLAGVPIRVILLKARQWGGSTLVQLYIAWIQLFHREGWNSFVVADVKEKALHIRAMYKRMVTNHPPHVFPFKLRVTPYEKTSHILLIPERQAILGVTSVQEPEGPRSFTTHLLHLSEYAYWPSTEKVNAENLITSLEGGIPIAPYTMIVKESTANGVGNIFHRDWQKAVNRSSTDYPFFVPWFEAPEYQQPVKEPEAFIKSWTEYEQFLWDKGATIEHIAWYREKLKNMPNAWKMKQEYPTTADEAFQTSGSRVFSPDRVLRARRLCKPPLLTGDLISDSAKGAGAFQNIRLVEGRGPLSVWTPPGAAGIEKDKKRYTNRYCAFMDPGGGTSDKADPSSVTVLDRIFTMFGGVPVVCAEFHGIMDPDLVAWYAARLCKWYDNALLAVEINSLLRDEGDEQRGYEPEHGYTVLEEIKDFYENLYYRVRPETIQEKWSGLLGFHTNKSTKVMIIDTLSAALRDDGYEERNEEACNEFDWFEKRADGKMGAVQGQHDDRVISRAGAIWLSQQMSTVKEVDATPQKKLVGKPGFHTFA